MEVKRYLSGIQPTGSIHLGNYFSVIKQSIENQNKADRESLYFIADLHALTQMPSKQSLQDNINNAIIDYLACGLDPKKVIFFLQSDVPAVSELYWLLSNHVPLGLLERSHSYKDKVSKGLASSHALLSYPVLMASDILIYNSDVVPVGRDQKQHIEITRDIANKFNNFYKKDILKIPEWEINKDTEKIPGIDGEKMSKSYKNTIPIFDTEKKQRKRIMSIKTDSAAIEDKKDPNKSIIYSLFSLLSNETEKNDFSRKFTSGGVSYGELKQELFDKYWDYFSSQRRKREELTKNSNYIKEILKSGAQRANSIASDNLKRIKSNIGLNY